MNFTKNNYNSRIIIICFLAANSCWRKSKSLRSLSLTNHYNLKEIFKSESGLWIRSELYLSWPGYNISIKEQ